MNDPLIKFETDPRTNCWRWQNTTPAGEPRRLWVRTKGRHIPPQRLLWDRHHPDDALDRNHSLRRTCQCACCVNPAHHLKVRRTNRKIIIHAPFTDETTRSRALARALHLAVHTPWSLDS